MSLNLPQARRFARRTYAPRMPRLHFAQAPLINGLGKRYTGRFYQPQVESIDAPAAGSGGARVDVQADGFVFCTGHPQAASGYEGDWVAELAVDAVTVLGFLYVATEAWIAGAKAAGASMYGVAVPSGGGHYIGNASAYGEANGVAAAFANSALSPSGLVAGFVVNQAARKLRLYYSGTHVGTFTLSAPGPYRPCIGGWAGVVQGTWLASPSIYSASYLVPT